MRPSASRRKLDGRGRRRLSPTALSWCHCNWPTICSLATTERFKNRAGEQEEKTDWHRCNFWGKGVDAIGQYLLKGTQLSVIGSIHTRTYEKDGEKRYMTEIRVYRIVLLGKPIPKNAPPSPSEDDIPF